MTTEQLVVVTTPRQDSLDGVREFLEFARQWQSEEKRIRMVVVAMPSQTEPAVRRDLIALLSRDEHLAEMTPAADGCGPLFKFAAEASFRRGDDIFAVIHVPIDADFSDPALHVKLLAGILDKPQVALMLGDYKATSLTKILVGNAVLEQLKHFDIPVFAQQARTEFWAIRRAAFESASKAGAFAPFDPIPFVSQYLGKKGLAVESVDLGTFHERDATSNVARACNQILRFVHQAASAFLQVCNEDLDEAALHACKAKLIGGLGKPSIEC